MPWKPSWCIVVARKTISGQEDEVAELYDLQDDLEQYTRKNSLEIHGVPESAYTSTEEVVLKLARAINVDVSPEDIEISHKLNRKGVKPIILKSQLSYSCLIDKAELTTLIVGGDWNCTLSRSDKVGGKPWKATNYSNLVMTTMDIFDLIDIQRVKHPKLLKYFYESKALKMKSRIVFFRCYKHLEQYVKKSEKNNLHFIVVD